MFDTCLTNLKKFKNKSAEFQNEENRAKYAFQPLFNGVKSISEACKFGAGDRVRTGDHLLGRQRLYQLSYTRFLW
jgi:hypothetical protein